MSYLDVITPYLNQIDTPETKLDQVVFDEALSKLEPIVEQMLRGDMNLVFNALYRLDIAEEKVKFILFGDHNEKASKLLAEAILQREIVRRIFRLKYSQQ
jgi:hypothetical protein